MTTFFQGPSSSPAKSLANFVTPEQKQARVERVWAKVSPLLVPGEAIEHLVVQAWTSLKVLPGAIVLTNRRAIFAQSGLFKMSFHDLPWRQLVDAHLSQGMYGATLTLLDVGHQRWGIDCLPKELASQAYAYAQQVEELAIEFRRQRQLEEVRAASKGVTLHDVAPVASSAPPFASVENSLQQLKSMADQGLISAAEYEAKKAEILSRM